MSFTTDQVMNICDTVLFPLERPQRNGIIIHILKRLKLTLLEAVQDEWSNIRALF